jgi:hypothetical protein
MPEDEMLSASKFKRGRHAFLYDNGKMHDLGALGAISAHDSSFAYAVNDHGQVAGFGYLPSLLAPWLMPFFTRLA